MNSTTEGQRTLSENGTRRGGNGPAAAGTRRGVGGGGNPSLTCTRHLGGTVTCGNTHSGSTYVSHSCRKAHTYCWMQIQLFDKFPAVPSLAGSRVQARQDLLASTAGAGDPAGRPFMLEFELFDDECPRTCANFRRLCSGHTTARMGHTFCYQGVTPSYRGTYFHKIIPGFVAQGGDITMRVTANGYNYHSSAGRGWFDDESKRRRHDAVGLLSMANNGPNSNGTQFFITTSDKHQRALNGRHVCFGRVVAGLEEFMSQVAPCGNSEGYPTRYAVVVDCGDGAAPQLQETVDSEGNTTAVGIPANNGNDDDIDNYGNGQYGQQQQQQQQWGDSTDGYGSTNNNNYTNNNQQQQQQLHSNLPPPLDVGNNTYNNNNNNNNNSGSDPNALGLGITPLAQAVLAANDIDLQELSARAAAAGGKNPNGGGGENGTAAADADAVPDVLPIAPTPPPEPPAADTIDHVPSDIILSETVDGGGEAAVAEAAAAAAAELENEKQQDNLAASFRGAQQPARSAIKKKGGETDMGGSSTKKHVTYSF